MSVQSAAVVTGAASGIGAACVERIMNSETLVYALDVSAAVNDRWNGHENVQPMVVDISSRSAVDAASEVVRTSGLPVTQLVNAAGRSGRTFLLDFEDEEFDRLVAVNLYGVAACMRAFGSLMREQDQPSAIVNIASMAARKVDKTFSIYGAVKAGVVQMSLVAALELARFNIRVNVVLPGPIDTPMLRASAQKLVGMGGASVEDVLNRYRDGVPLARLGSPDEVAELAGFLLSDDAGFITGECIGVGGGNHLL